MKYKTIVDKNSPISIFNETSKDNNVFIFESEIDKKHGYQLFVENHICDILDLNLCLFKEASAGRGGSVDYLAVDDEGRIFLIEVKCSYDNRAKFDVVFQTLKYYLDPNTISQELLDVNKKVTLKDNESTENIINTFKLNTKNIDSFAQKIYENLKGNHINPVIVVDKVTPQLIATAYSILMRNTGSECKVIELNQMKIDGTKYTYSRKYATTDDWVSVGNTNNRTPHLTCEERLNRFKNSELKNFYFEVVKKMESLKSYSFSWNSPAMPDFNILFKQPGKRKITIRTKIYTDDFSHDPSNERIKAGSMRFSGKSKSPGSYELKDFLKDHNLDYNAKSWESSKHINNYFIIPPEDILSFKPSDIVELIKSYKNFYIKYCD
ncbi:hypothetical protein ACFL20_06600 [Spirochaetota bacterium]